MDKQVLFLAQKSLLANFKAQKIREYSLYQKQNKISLAQKIFGVSEHLRLFFFALSLTQKFAKQIDYVSKFPGNVNNISENVQLTKVKIVLSYLEVIKLNLNTTMLFVAFQSNS